MAYGARLESVLGATPREFESRILRRAELLKHRSSVPTRWRLQLRWSHLLVSVSTFERATWTGPWQGRRIATPADAELLGDGEYCPVLVLWLGFPATGAKRSEDAGSVGLPGLALFER